MKWKMITLYFKNGEKRFKTVLSIRVSIIELQQIIYSSKEVFLFNIGGMNERFDMFWNDGVGGLW